MESLLKLCRITFFLYALLLLFQGLLTASKLIICHAYVPCKSPQTQHLQY